MFFDYTKRVFRSLTGSEKIEPGSVLYAGIEDQRMRIRMIMEVLVSLLLLSVSLWVVINGVVDESSEKYFSGLIGTVAGYWLRPSDRNPSG